MGRFDYQLSSRDRIFGRYIYQNSLTTNVNFFSPAEAVTGGFVNVGGTSHYVGADWTHTFSQRFLNQARYSYSHSNVEFGGGGCPGCTDGSILSGCPIRVSFADATDLALGEQNQFWPQGRVIESSQFQDNATWQAGKHSIKFGGEFNHFPETDYGIPYLNGFFVFTSFDSFIQAIPI